MSRTCGESVQQAMDMKGFGFQWIAHRRQIHCVCVCRKISYQNAERCLAWCLYILDHQWYSKASCLFISKQKSITLWVEDVGG